VAVEVKVIGEARLSSTLDGAARKMGDLPGFPEAAAIINAASVSGAPRRTGRLAGSMVSRRTGPNVSEITSPLVYAVPIHWGSVHRDIAANPYVVRAADATEGSWGKAIEKSAQDVLDGVQGA